MMKNLYKIIIAILLFIPSFALAQTTAPNGGTGLTSYTAGDIIYAATTNPIRFTKLPIGANGSCVGVAAGLPSYIPCVPSDSISPWATTTSSDPSKLIVYPKNNTDVVTIGSNSTTTSLYWFDPIKQISYLVGNVGIGTTSPVVSLDVLSTTGQALSVTGGVAGVSIARFARRSGAVADIAINASGGDPQFVFSRNNTSEFSMGDDSGVFRISGSGALGTSDILSATASGNVGIGSSSPSSVLSVTGDIYQRGGYTHLGTADSAFSCKTFSVICAELVGNDNTTGGVLMQIENKSPGTSAYVGFTMLNDLAYLGNNASYYAGLFLNGSGYNDPTFGPLNNVPNILQVGNTMGSITLQASSTGSNPSYISFATGGIQMNNERVRINTFGLGVGTTTTRWPLQAVSTSTSQLVLSSDPTAQHFSIRTGNGNAYMSFINPSTFATSTTPNISFSTGLGQTAIGTSTFAPGVQLTLGGGFNPVPLMYDSISSTGMYTIYRNSNIDMGYIGSALVLFSGSPSIKQDFAIRGSTNITFGVGAREQMRLNPSGYLGIGTSTPYVPLSVVGAGGIVTSIITATSTSPSIFAGGINLTGNLNCTSNCTVGSNSTTVGSISTFRGSGSVDGSAEILSTLGVGTSDSIRFSVGSNGNRRALFVDTNGNITVGTSSPLANETAQFTIVATSTATRLNLFEARTPNLGVATTSVFTITGTGVQLASSTPPTLSTCGTNPTVTGNNNWGTVTTGAGASACTVTFANSGFPTFASCVVTNQSMSVVNAMTYTVSATAFTVSQTGLGGSIINYRCDGY